MSLLFFPFFVFLCNEFVHIVQCLRSIFFNTLHIYTSFNPLSLYCSFVLV
ncbi:hypothetical protein IC575_003720 [Cucumis melo]